LGAEGATKEGSPFLPPRRDAARASWRGGTPLASWRRSGALLRASRRPRPNLPKRRDVKDRSQAALQAIVNTSLHAVSHVLFAEILARIRQDYRCGNSPRPAGGYVLTRGRDPSPQPPARSGLTSPPKHERDSTRAGLIRLEASSLTAVQPIYRSSCSRPVPYNGDGGRRRRSLTQHPTAPSVVTAYFTITYVCRSSSVGCWVGEGGRDSSGPVLSETYRRTRSHRLTRSSFQEHRQKRRGLRAGRGDGTRASGSRNHSGSSTFA
jgi:hypothetical protein